MLWEKLRSIAGDLLIGQALSALLTVTSVCSKVLADRGVAVPTAQSAINYVLLFLVFMGPRLARAAAGRSRPALALPWWRYALIAVADVEGNFLVVKAFQLTSFTSAMLLDAFAIPCVMGLGCLLLAARYRPPTSPAPPPPSSASSSSSPPTPAASAGRAPPRATRSSSPAPPSTPAPTRGARRPCGPRATRGAPGRPAALAGSAPRWPGECWAAFAGFGAALFALTAAVPRVLRGPGAVVLNLGLLTSDFYALAVGSLAFGTGPRPSTPPASSSSSAIPPPPPSRTGGGEGYTRLEDWVGTSADADADAEADEEALRAGGEGRLPPSQSTAPSLPQLQAQS
eukprot:tig00020911_g15726.t1